MVLLGCAVSGSLSSHFTLRKGFYGCQQSGAPLCSLLEDIRTPTTY